MSPPVLNIGKGRGGLDFTLPLELVTQSVAILAKRGVGKTYTAAVLCEEIHDAGVPPIIIDPTGAHWGMKSSANGKGAGLPFVVFGGENADLPLDDDAGEVVARAIVARRFPAIMDLSLMRKAAIHRFLVAFFETLYRINRQALHLVCDEADVYAPQKPFGEEARTLGAMQDIVRRGRIRGIGCTLITQRPQVLNKDVLTQCEVLITMRLVHPKDIGAIKEWVDVHGDPQQAKDLIASLPSLPVGHAWFWSPGLGDIFERVAIRRRRTFDSSATPKPGEVRVSPERFAEVDIAKLGSELADAARAVQDNDPVHLKAEISRLRSQLKLAIPPEALRVEVKVPDAEKLRELRIRLNDIDSLVSSALKPLQAQLESLASIRADLAALHQVVASSLEPNSFAGRGGTAPSVGVPNRNDTGQAPRESVSPWPIARAARPQAASAGISSLSKAERLILTCLAQFGSCSKNKIAAITGYAVNGGGFNNSLSALRSKLYITSGDPMQISSQGSTALGAYDPLPTGKQLVDFWLRQLNKAEAAILNQVCRAYPNPLTKDAIATFTGYQADGGGFNNALSRLRTLELITGRGEIRASENLF